jgi:four helix bundle protein
MRRETPPVSTTAFALIMKPQFLSLDVVRLAERLANIVWKMVRRWDYFTKKTLGSQLVRAADAVGANLAEGVGRGTPADNRRFIRIARGSLNETHYFCRQALQRSLMNEEEARQIQALLTELPPRLNAYLRSVKNHPDPMKQTKQCGTRAVAASK